MQEPFSRELKYLGVLGAAQTPVLVAAVLARTQIADRPIASAALATGWLFISGFAIKVWKEVEEDAVKGAAEILRAMPGKAADVFGRLKDVAMGGLIAWSPGFTRRYLREIRRAYGLFNDKGLGLINANRLDLDKVYIELKAAGDVNLNRPNLNPVTHKISGRASFWEHFRALRPGFGMVIIGAPGSGKTTLLQHILLTYAWNRQWRKKMRARVPFFIELRRIVPELTADKQPTLAKIIESVLKKNLPGLNERIPRRWIERRLASGRCVLLWDGLDEVADPVQRKKVSAWLDEQIAKGAWAGTISLISARPAGYRDARLDRAHVLEVQPFDYDDTRRFIEQWYHANEIVSHGNRDDADVRYRAQQGAVDLRARLSENPRLGVLTGNPLLLTMVCMVHCYHGALPGSRGQLYAEICQVLLERWRHARGIREEHRGEQKLNVLRYVARQMMERRVKELSKDEIVAAMSAPLSLLGVAASEADAFLGRIQESSGLLLEVSPGQWSFAHLSFQEFLCADFWAQRPDFAPSDWNVKIEDSWWRESILLYASKASDASAVVKAALDAKSARGLALALAVLAEKPNFDAATRERLAHAMTDALACKDEEVFVLAAEALLLHRNESGYHVLSADDERQLGVWVSEAEYQLFLIDLPRVEAPLHVPLHWRQFWFPAAGDAPLVGISPLSAERYCKWLNKRFPDWKHSLPDFADFIVPIGEGGGLEPLMAVTNTGREVIPASQHAVLTLLKSWLNRCGWRVDPKRVLAARNLDFDLARDLALANTRDLDWALAHDLAQSFEHSGDHSVGIARALVSEIARDVARGIAIVRTIAFDRDPVCGRVIGHDLVSAVSVVLGLPLVRTRVYELSLARVLALHFSLARTFARGYASELNLTRYHDLDLDLICSRAHVLARDLAVALKRDLQLSLRIYIGRRPAGEDRQLEELLTSADRLGRRRVNCLRRILKVLESETPQENGSAWRRFFVAAFDAVREYDPGLISDNIFKTEAFIRLIVAREEGELPAWEGLRIARQKRR